ncbi:hypothetical protein AB0425_23440 [Actinosynnema sp. NPDC051121]
MKAIVAVLAVVAMASTGCEHPMNSENSGADTRERTVPSPESTSKTVPPSSSTRQPTGTVTATRAGGQATEVVNCDAISSDVTVRANGGGRAQWTAEAKRGAGFADSRATGVTVSPSSGELDEGQSTVVHVGGTLDPNNSANNKSGKYFSVLVSNPNSGGRGGVSLEFRCR